MPTCNHSPRAVCWLCSDQVPWWAEARIKAGAQDEPPNERPAIPLPVIALSSLCVRRSCTFDATHEKWCRYHAPLRLLKAS